MAQWKRELSADDVRLLVDWFLDTYINEKYPTVWHPASAEKLAQKIDEVKTQERGY
jgi:hypothetical protein